MCSVRGVRAKTEGQLVVTYFKSVQITGQRDTVPKSSTKLVQCRLGRLRGSRLRVDQRCGDFDSRKG